MRRERHKSHPYCSTYTLLSARHNLQTSQRQDCCHCHCRRGGLYPVTMCPRPQAESWEHGAHHPAHKGGAVCQRLRPPSNHREAGNAGGHYRPRQRRGSSRSFRYARINTKTNPVLNSDFSLTRHMVMATRGLQQAAGRPETKALPWGPASPPRVTAARRVCDCRPHDLKHGIRWVQGAASATGLCRDNVHTDPHTGWTASPGAGPGARHCIPRP